MACFHMLPKKNRHLQAHGAGTPFAISPVRILLINHLEINMKFNSSKLAAVVASLLVNCLILGAVGMLFEMQSHALAVAASART